MYFNNKEVSASAQSNQVDTTTIGTYIVEYKSTYNEKEYKVIRYVAIVDETKPQLQLKAGIDT